MALINRNTLVWQDGNVLISNVESLDKTKIYKILDFDSGTKCYGHLIYDFNFEEGKVPLKYEKSFKVELRDDEIEEEVLYYLTDSCLTKHKLIKSLQNCMQVTGEKVLNACKDFALAEGSFKHGAHKWTGDIEIDVEIKFDNDNLNKDLEQQYISYKGNEIGDAGMDYVLDGFSESEKEAFFEEIDALDDIPKERERVRYDR